MEEYAGIDSRATESARRAKLSGDLVMGRVVFIHTRRPQRQKGFRQSILLFLLQRSQAKDSLAMQVKLNELLAAVDKASPTLINLEDRTEEEAWEIHDRYQELEVDSTDSASIDDIKPN